MRVNSTGIWAWIWPLLALGASGAALGFVVAQRLTAGGVPSYVVRVPLTGAGEQLALPPIEGPADPSRPLVVIDAGHGGHDPGASGPNGLKEKAVTLALVLATRDALLKHGRVRVALTRDDDHFLVLGERALLARRLGADMFLSIHADAVEQGDPSGATVYTLSDQASDEVAARLASRENRADLVNGMPLDGQSQAVSSILVDLSRSDTARQSQALSSLIVREGKGSIAFHVDPQRHAGFAVLKSLDMPSALFEAGYVSSADDARRLSDPAWRARFGERLARAIEIFVATKTAGVAR
ncbi:N-acetylmuramoyl-L-alanine amidase [Novosphingobium sp.]|uniref:N-acetylmuramoyl-L-alanine amidase family protein n=1 Tax=Novosphingobium sp. TaxID=1874826 RepID=UPI0025DE66FF|nr:N-acetylmuramoyl-L-alanine amidase [Novosphingobium sp.]